MVSRSNREYITVQLLETQRMLNMAGGHPLMSISLKQKEQYLIQQLEKIPVDKKDTKVTLLFNGNPVRGSWGIDAAFIGKITVPFQQMVTADFAHSIDGKVGKRGQLKNENQSRLFLTALPRGSFGIELSKQESDSVIENDQLSDSLSHITRLVDATARSDEDFAAELDGTSPRTIQNLKDFLKIISDEQAGVTIESGGIWCDLTPASVKRAAERAGSTVTTENIKTIQGTFKGILLESWRFDFRDNNGNTITGDISGHVSERQANEYMSKYFNKECSAVLKEGKVLFKNGRERISYTLQSLEP